jgi:general nucleoside transport system permease protein
MTRSLAHAPAHVLPLKVVRRPNPSPAWQVLSVFISLLAAFAVTAVLIYLSGASAVEALSALWKGSFGSPKAIVETLVKSTPLILVGLGTTIAFRAKVWNIGGEGQLVAGALAAYGMTRLLAGLPPALIVIAAILGAMAGGALWGGIAGVLKARFNVDEIIVTVLLNYIMAYLLSFLLMGPWRDPSGYFAQTSLLSDGVELPLLISKSRLHLGFAFALLMAVAVYVLLWKTPLGFEIRAIGSNRVAARFQGLNAERLLVLVMLISGALAGLAGGSELIGLHHRLRMDISVGYGFTGIIIALLGRLHPAGTVLAAIFFGALVNGATRIQVATGVPVALIDAIQGIVLLFLLTSDALSRYQIRRTHHA